MVARNHDPVANANDPLGDEHGGNLDQPPSDVDEVTPSDVDNEPKHDEPKHEDKPKPPPSGPGLRTTNTPTRRR